MRDPSIQMIFAFGPKVCIYFLQWAIWTPRVRDWESLYGSASYTILGDILGPPIYGNYHVQAKAAGTAARTACGSKNCGKGVLTLGSSQGP